MARTASTPPTEPTGPTAPELASLDRQLQTAGRVFAIAVTVHTIDHLRRGQGSIPELLYVAGNLSLVVSIVTVTLILTRHRLGPLLAAASGIPLAIGFAAAHWLPEWSDMSDPVWEVTTWPALSYVASAFEIVAAAAVGIAGIRVVRAHGLEAFATPSPVGPTA